MDNWNWKILTYTKEKVDNIRIVAPDRLEIAMLQHVKEYGTQAKFVLVPTMEKPNVL